MNRRMLLAALRSVDGCQIGLFKRRNNGACGTRCYNVQRSSAPAGAHAHMSRESMDFDVVVIGAGPAGLATACRLAQLARAANREITIGVVEKGSAVGAHIVSGAVLEPRALDELFPDWRERGAPVKTAVTTEHVDWLSSATGGVRLPEVL